MALDTHESANGHSPKATKAEHESLKSLVERKFEEQALEIDRLHEKLDFALSQLGLVGSAIELLLKDRGLDDD